MTNIYCQNTPRDFWLLKPDPPEEVWFEAYKNAFPKLGIATQTDDIDAVIRLILGEGQFGSGHFSLNLVKRLYYILKPLLPCWLRYALRRQSMQYSRTNFQLRWPIEDRYVHFQYEVIRQILTLQNHTFISFRHFWPNGYQFAFVLTHDIETAEGQAFAREVADLEERLGFRSSFNFVPECYPLDIKLMQELRERGFEVGLHGIKHDGKLFNSKHLFMKRAERINQYLKEFRAVGFRSPLTLRNPDWMQTLEIDYDLSFFDTDPFQPMPGGVMSIWPFTIGNFIELPYTLPQDCTLTRVLGENILPFWLEKLEFIEQNFGLALVNTHPDYLLEPSLWDMYSGLLSAVKENRNYWHALPCEVARWWRKRSDVPLGKELPEMTIGTILQENGEIEISLPQDSSQNGYILRSKNNISFVNEKIRQAGIKT